MFGARKPPTMRVPVIFERDVAAACSTTSLPRLGRLQRRRRQLVADRTRWASASAASSSTIVDDGRLPGRLGSSPFDGEGVATRRTPVFERGVAAHVSLRHLLRAQAGRGEHRQLDRRRDRTEQLLPRAGHGLARRTDRRDAARRSRARHDRLCHRARQRAPTAAARAVSTSRTANWPIRSRSLPIAGQFPEMLAAASTRSRATCGSTGPVVSPSFRVAEMTVSGELVRKGKRRAADRHRIYARSCGSRCPTSRARSASSPTPSATPAGAIGAVDMRSVGEVARRARRDDQRPRRMQSRTRCARAVEGDRGRARAQRFATRRSSRTSAARFAVEPKITDQEPPGSLHRLHAGRRARLDGDRRGSRQGVPTHDQAQHASRSSPTARPCSVWATSDRSARCR